MTRYLIDNKYWFYRSENASGFSSAGPNEVSMQTPDAKEKKKTGSTTTSNVSGSAGNRSKDKKKENNHATPMETSDEEAQNIESIGKYILFIYLIE